MGEDDDAGQERQPDERAGEGDHARLPGKRRGAIGAPGQKDHGSAADDQDRRAQVDEARDEAERSHSQSKLSVTGLRKRAAAAPMVGSDAAPSVSVTFVVSSGSVTSAP